MLVCSVCSGMKMLVVSFHSGQVVTEAHAPSHTHNTLNLITLSMATHVIHSGMHMPDPRMEPVSIRRVNEPHGEWLCFESVTAAAKFIGTSRGHLSKVVAGAFKHTNGWTARREPKPQYEIANGCKKCKQCCYVWEMRFFWSERGHREIKLCHICTQKNDDNRKKDPVYREIAALWAEYKQRPCVDCGETSEFIEADHVYGKPTRALCDILWWVQNGGVAAWKREAALTLPRRMDYHRLKTWRWARLKKELLEKRGHQPTETTTGATEPKTAEQLYMQVRRAEGLAHIYAIKRKIGLCECGCGRRVEHGMEFLFDWDHKDPAKKTRNIGQMATSSKETLRREMGKCRLLHCLCHRAHTRHQYAERVAKRMKAIAEMEQAKAVADVMASLLSTLTGPPLGPLAAPLAAPAAPAAAAPAVPAIAMEGAAEAAAPKNKRKKGQGRIDAWMIKKARQ